MSNPAHKVVVLDSSESEPARPQPGTAFIPNAEQITKLQRFRDRYYVVCSLSTVQIDGLRQLESSTGKTFHTFIDDILAIPGATLSHPRD